MIWSRVYWVHVVWRYDGNWGAVMAEPQVTMPVGVILWVVWGETIVWERMFARDIMGGMVVWCHKARKRMVHSSGMGREIITKESATQHITSNTVTILRKKWMW